MDHSGGHATGRLTGRAPTPPARPAEPGVHALPGSASGQHLLFIPAERDLPEGGSSMPAEGRARMPQRSPAPLVVMLHGSGSDPLRMLRLVERAAAAAGVALLLPKSSGYTWDAVLGAFGPDVAEIDRLLEAALRLTPVDPRRLAVGGFSDGASYALSLGRVNGDRFGRVLAFSPGFMVPGRPTGTPRIFISHGTSDSVLPIERCSRLLVPALRREGCDVDYREFDGGHVVPHELVAAAFAPLSAGDVAD